MQGAGATSVYVDVSVMSAAPAWTNRLGARANNAAAAVSPQHRSRAADEVIVYFFPPLSLFLSNEKV